MASPDQTEFLLNILNWLWAPAFTVISWFGFNSIKKSEIAKRQLECEVRDLIEQLTNIKSDLRIAEAEKNHSDTRITEVKKLLSELIAQLGQLSSDLNRFNLRLTLLERGKQDDSGSN
jgi:chromosome segregation ATPase